VALDRSTGAVLWEKKIRQRGGWHVCVVGAAGGEGSSDRGSSRRPTRGCVGLWAALSASTGEELWRTHTIPAKGRTWVGDLGKLCGVRRRSDLAVGNLRSEVEPAVRTTGNAWPDFYGGDRKGDNLYSSSLLALDADTGKMKWYFQFTPHDTHDWDAQAWPVLVDLPLPYKGKMRKLVLHANRNGFFYVLDRVTGEYLNATRLVEKLDWGVGASTQRGGRFWFRARILRRTGIAFARRCKGLTNWMSPSFNPAIGLLYVVTLEQCDNYTSSSKEPTPKMSFSGGGRWSQAAGCRTIFFCAPSIRKRASVNGNIR